METSVKIISPELCEDVDHNNADSDCGLCDFEEYGTLWLFGYKELLNWKEDIQWLFSPVTGKYPYPGDLWGIDQSGNLIIAETKLSKTHIGQDPFIDFVGYERKLENDGLHVLDPEFLLARWKKLLRKELEFIERYSHSLHQGTDGPMKFSGIVPYSRKRFAVWRWRHFYLSVIVPMIKGGYQDLVSQYLKVRNENPFATQHYFGILVASSGAMPKLASKGEQNYAQLCMNTSKERVHLCRIQAAWLSDSVQLTSQVS